MYAPLLFRATALLGIVALCTGFRPPPQTPYPDLDKRSRKPAVAATKHTAAGKLRQTASDATVKFDEVTHSAAHVTAARGFLSGPEGKGRAISDEASKSFAKQDPHRAIKAFLKQHRELFGHGAEALEAATVKRDFVTPHNRMHTTVWEQQLNGIPVFEGVLISRTTWKGELVSVSSQFVSDAAMTSHRAKAHRATLAAQDAVQRAAQNLEVLVPPRDIALLEKAADARQQHRFQIQQLVGDTTAELVWLPMNKDEMRLCWEVILKVRSRGEFFRVLIDAETGDVILRRCLTSYLTTNATYRVFTSDSPSPFSPGLPTPATNQPPFIERSLLTLSALNTNASPAGWLDDSVNETRGNNVDAHLDRDSDDEPELPRPQGAPFRVFDFPLDLAQAPTLYGDAAVVQLFYWNNFMHDKLYELGFTEAAGNFQVNNFGRGGVGNDAVQADTQDGSGTDNANMSTLGDGVPPRMQMYLFSGADPDRDGVFDAEVVLHEYTHGLSTRLVGGGIGISQLQTEGMGEGWSDFYALALLSEPDDDVNATYAMAAYATFHFHGLLENYYYGIRRYPYCTDMTKNPLTFRDIDPAQASSHSAVPQSPVFSGLRADEVHAQGEVWCVTLWEARANLIAKHGWTNGNRLILQLVTDGMNLSPANPNFLQARDAIIQADEINNDGANRLELWTAFAKRGMGASATSPSSSTTVGLQEAFDFPDDLNVTPSEGFVSSGPVGGPFNTVSRTFTLRNTGSNALLWSALSMTNWLDVSPPGGALQTGQTASVTVTLNSHASTLTTGLYSGAVRFTNLTTGIGQSRSFLLRIAQPDYFTELFQNGIDLNNSMFTFTPDGSPAFYAVCREAVTNFPTDPSGGNVVTLVDDAFEQIVIEGTNSVSVYGYATNYLEIGSNGYLTFDGGDEDYSESVSDHFRHRRVAALFRDLYPPNTNSVISWLQLSNRFAVTYENVPEYGQTNSNNFQIEMFFDGNIRITYLQIDALRGLAGLSAGLGVPAGFDESDWSSYDSCDVPLFIPAIAARTEGDGTITNGGLVVLPFALETNVTVTLASSDTPEIAVPSEVIIPAGETNAFFDLTIIDDAELDGTQTAAITATAAGFAPGGRAISINDNESATFGIMAPLAVTEGAGATQALVFVSAPVGKNVLVYLTSSDITELQVPDSVFIPAGQTSAVFAVTAADDSEIDGPQTATITATVTNWVSGAADIVVADNEITNLSVLSLSPSYSENAGLKQNFGTVFLSGTLPTNLVVSLLSSDPSSLLAPSTVVIMAGEQTVSFDLTLLDNAQVDGARVVTISASADAFTSGNTTITIYDDEIPPLPAFPNPPHLASNVIASTTLSWSAGTNTTNDVYFGTNPNPGPTEFLGTTTGTNWTLPQLAPAMTYYWQIVSHRIGTTIGEVWSFTTRGLHYFLVSAGETHYVGVPFPLTITAKDEFNATVSNFTGVVQLKGQIGSGEVFHADFESGLGGFALDNSSGRSNGLWHLTTARGSQGGHSGASSLYYGQGEEADGQGNYDTGTPHEGTATSPPLNLASVLPPISLTFSHFIETELGTNSDRTTVELSTNDGASYTIVAARFPEGQLTNDSGGTWLTETVDLTSFASNSARVRFHFDAPERASKDHEGWFIDDVAVSGQPFPLPMVPLTSAAFVEGRWTGDITALAAGTNVFLIADDGAGHKGSTASFRVIGGPQVSIFGSSNDVVVMWTAIAGQTYRVEMKTNLDDAWSSSGPDIIATGATASITNSIPPPQKFYRVLLLPP